MLTTRSFQDHFGFSALSLTFNGVTFDVNDANGVSMTITLVDIGCDLDDFLEANFGASPVGDHLAYKLVGLALVFDVRSWGAIADGLSLSFGYNSLGA